MGPGCRVLRDQICKSLKLIVWCKFSFDERVVINRVENAPNSSAHGRIRSVASRLGGTPEGRNLGSFLKRLFDRH